MKKSPALAIAVFAAAMGLGACTHAQKVKFATSAGDIVVELDAAKAPKTVENFVQYVKAGQYNGTIFHRVIPNFMIQGGGLTPDLTEKRVREVLTASADRLTANGKWDKFVGWGRLNLFAALRLARRP